MNKYIADIEWAGKWLREESGRLVGRVASPAPVEDIAVFRHFVSRAKPPYLEIGVLWGGSMIVASRAIDGPLYGIDPFWGYNKPKTIDPHVPKGNDGAGVVPTIDIARANFKEFGIEDRVTLHKGLHPPLPKEWEGMRFGVVYIDGDHFVESTLADWNAAKLYADTVIFHDLHNKRVNAAWEIIKGDPLVKEVLYEGGKDKFSRMGVVKCYS